MAELSADTLAILDRLKAEGALIRNGTNSVRSVNLKLDQFKPVFDAISANVIEQTALMKMQKNSSLRRRNRCKNKQNW